MLTRRDMLAAMAAGVAIPTILIRAASNEASKGTLTSTGEDPHAVIAVVADQPTVERVVAHRSPSDARWASMAAARLILRWSNSCQSAPVVSLGA